MIDDLKVVLFDLDGTIIDTEPYHYKCWNSILNNHGFDISYQHYLANFAGVAIDQNCERLIERYQLNAGVKDLRAQKEEMMIDFLLNNDLSAMPYVRDTIDFLIDQQIKLGLVTSSSAEETKIILRGLHLEHVFSYIVTRDDVVNKKPHPEPYLSAKQFFNLPANSFVVFEDSISGIESAKDAGLKCFAIREGVPPDSNYHAIADGVFEDFAMLSKALFHTEIHG